MAWCSMFAIDFAINDGVLFFTRELEGKGKRISLGLSIFVIISLIIIVTTLFAWHFRQKKYYIFHVLWQLIFVSYIFFLVYTLLMRVFVYKYDPIRKMMIPSAVTIAVFCTIAGICEMWWLFIMVDALLYEGKDDCSSRRASDNEPYKNNSVPVLLINDSEKIDV